MAPMPSASAGSGGFAGRGTPGSMSGPGRNHSSAPVQATARAMAAPARSGWGSAVPRSWAAHPAAAPAQCGPVRGVLWAPGGLQVDRHPVAVALVQRPDKVSSHAGAILPGCGAGTPVRPRCPCPRPVIRRLAGPSLARRLVFDTALSGSAPSSHIRVTPTEEVSMADVFEVLGADHAQVKDMLVALEESQNHAPGGVPGETV